MASLIHDIIKYTVLILCLINVVLVAYYLIDGLLNKRMGNGEQIAYLVILILIYGGTAYAAHIENALYLLISGIVIVVGLATNFLLRSGNSQDLTLGRGAMTILAILVFLFAFITHRGNI